MMMSTRATATAILLLLAGCARHAPVNASGNWYFFCGGRLTLVQDGKMLSGSGHIPNNPRPTEASPTTIPITVQGKALGDRVFLTLKVGTNTLEDVEFLLAISPKAAFGRNQSNQSSVISDQFSLNERGVRLP
jgi:hypothetical protein